MVSLLLESYNTNWYKQLIACALVLAQEQTKVGYYNHLYKKSLENRGFNALGVYVGR